jgi:hypothetical protein
LRSLDVVRDRPRVCQVLCCWSTGGRERKWKWLLLDTIRLLLLLLLLLQVKVMLLRIMTCRVIIGERLCHVLLLLRSRGRCWMIVMLLLKLVNAHLLVGIQWLLGVPLSPWPLQMIRFTRIVRLT